MHLTFTADKLYLNGEPVELEVTKNTLTKPFTEPDVPVTLGGRIEADRLRGRVDDLRFYNRELSPAEIKTLYRDVPLAEHLASKSRAKEQEAALRDWYLANAAPAETKKLNAELLSLKAERDDLTGPSKALW